jgi:hypothetical protein
MKNQIPNTLLQGIKDLHIKILQANDLPEIGSYLQEILDKVIPVLPASAVKVKTDPSKVLSKSRIINMLKSDIKSILDGSYSRLEIAKHKATLDIAWLKGIFTETIG